MNSDDLFQLEDRNRREYLRIMLACGALGPIPYGLASASWFSSSPEKMAEQSGSDPMLASPPGATV